MFLTISINFHKPISVEYIFSIAGVFTVAHIEMDTIHVYCAQYTDGILLVMHFVLVVECFLCKVIFGQTTSGSDSCELPAKRTWNPYGPETADRRPLKEQCGTPKHY